MSTHHGGILEAVLLELKALNAEIKALRGDLAQFEFHPPSQDLPADARGNGREAGTKGQAETEAEDGPAAPSLVDWLASRHITVKNYRQEQATDEILDRLATFLGERFDSVQTFHDQIRRTLSTGGNVTLNLSSASQAEIGNTTQLCSWLHKYAFLSAYHYNNDQKNLYASPQRVGKVINFFNGGWFERFVTLQVSGFLAERGWEAAHLANPRITLPNGDDFELDLIYLVENKPLWLECKTGDYQAHVKKYAEVRPILDIPEARAILVILGISDSLASQLTSLYKITVANERTLLARVAEALNPDAKEASTPSATASPAQPITPTGVSTGGTSGPPTKPHPLSTLLNKASLRPLPEVRAQAIAELLDLVAEMDAPQAMTEIKPVLADRLALSRSKTQDLLNAIVRGRCLVDPEGQPMINFIAPFARLDPSDPDAIEQRCMESYARAVLQVHPDYFSSNANIRTFESITGGVLPDEETLAGLRAQITETEPA